VPLAHVAPAIRRRSLLERLEAFVLERHNSTIVRSEPPLATKPG
jgi:hypothetical protein